MSRAITILGSIQMFLIVAGVFLVRAVLEYSGYPDDVTVRWNGLSVAIRNYGFLLVLVPVLWVLYAIYSKERCKGIHSPRTAFVVGIALVILWVLLFLYAATDPFTRITLFYIGS